MIPKDIRNILLTIINHYEEDIQWWDSDEEEQAYDDVHKVRLWLIKQTANEMEELLGEIDERRKRMGK